ncbi:hypothetical protein GC177_09615 [bacterium]|nr:hypothetical protein [bacterium]
MTVTIESTAPYYDQYQEFLACIRQHPLYRRHFDSFYNQGIARDEIGLGNAVEMTAMQVFYLAIDSMGLLPSDYRPQISFNIARFAHIMGFAIPAEREEMAPASRRDGRDTQYTPQDLLALQQSIAAEQLPPEASGHIAMGDPVVGMIHTRGGRVVDGDPNLPPPPVTPTALGYLDLQVAQDEWDRLGNMVRAIWNDWAPSKGYELFFQMPELAAPEQEFGDDDRPQVSPFDLPEDWPLVDACRAFVQHVAHHERVRTWHIKSKPDLLLDQMAVEEAFAAYAVYVFYNYLLEAHYLEENQAPDVNIDIAPVIPVMNAHNATLAQDGTLAADIPLPAALNLDPNRLGDYIDMIYHHKDQAVGMGLLPMNESNSAAVDHAVQQLLIDWVQQGELEAAIATSR